MLMQPSKKIKGFSLLELMVVMSIGIFLAYSLGYSASSLQNNIKVDSALRNIKTEIQTTQNSARNSFISYGNNSNAGGLIPNNLKDTKISVGWIITLRNTSISGTDAVEVIRQSVYFYPTGYDLSLLRDEIQNNLKLKTDLNCIGDTLYSGESTISVKNTDPANPSRSTAIFKCTNTTGSDEEKVMTKFNAVQLTQPGAGEGISSCFNGSRSSIFFTSGYGETVLGASSPCQIQITSTGSLSAAKRAIKISGDTGSITTCGRVCH